MGENEPHAIREGLNTGGVGGVQMADVSRGYRDRHGQDEPIVAVQDCGLIINPKTAESQIYGACIMSICAALYRRAHHGPADRPHAERRHGVLQAGRHRRHRRDHRPPGHPPENDKRGVIGLGEPPAIGGIAAIANAVANAIGVRVPHGPLTPDRVLDALEGRNA